MAMQTDQDQQRNQDRVAFNMFDRSWRADPYPLYRRLRAEAPAGPIPGVQGMWYLARAASCEAVLRDPRVSTEARNAERSRPTGVAGDGRPRMAEDTAGGQRSFLFMDPPDHTRLRTLVSSAFTVKVVNRLKPRIQQLIDELLDAAVARGRLEIVEDLAYPLPFIIISELLGLPVADQPRFRAWSKTMTGSLDPTVKPSPEVVERQMAAMRECRQYLGDLIDQRRREPQDDLITALTQAEEQGDRLSKDELLATILLLMAAGHETTANLIANGVLALVEHSEQLARLAADPGLGRAAAEETLRWDPPIQMTRRIPLEDLKLDGVTIPRRSTVMLLLASANRDEAVTPDPERFDIGRGEFRHLAFGMGPHFCLGASLGRLEAAAALATLAARFPNARLAPDGLRRRNDYVMRGPTVLHLEV
jgi:cytochrome P450